MDGQTFGSLPSIAGGLPIINDVRTKLGENRADNHAVAIDNIIVFSSIPEYSDIFFWAHEIQHTVQYSNLGIEAFSSEYTSNYKRLESDADEVAKIAEENASQVAAIIAALENGGLE